MISIFLTMLLLPYPAGYIQANRALPQAQSPTTLESPDLDENTIWLPSVRNYKENAPMTQTGCHFGITTPYSVDGYDLSTLGVDSYLDWGQYNKNSTVADNIQYYRVINVSDAKYASNLAMLPTLVSTYPGSVWIIGNEPDSEVAYQDHISAESYAERFHTMAKIIRLNDPSARIAFGTVIQPTPVRLYYLDKVIDRLVQLEQMIGGNRASALGLIDIYSIHAFILNERPLYTTPNCGDCWGAGVPVGYDPGSWPAPQIITMDKTFDINFFTSRVTAFRQWMNALGPLEQEKPLWITEFGSLFTTDLGVSDLTTATYMDQTFDFMLETKDPSLGFASDDNRLVQKWLWYSLNENISQFGGSLYNPLTHELTTVGEHFIQYNPSLSAVPALDPDVYIDPLNFSIVQGALGEYEITLKVGNNLSSDRLTEVRVSLYIEGNLVGSADIILPRCAGEIPVTIAGSGLRPSQDYTFSAQVSLVSATETDTNPANNEIVLPPITTPFFYNVMLPITFR